MSNTKKIKKRENYKTIKEVVDIEFETSISNSQNKNVLFFFNLLFLIFTYLVFVQKEVYGNIKTLIYTLFVFVVPFLFKYLDMYCYSKFRIILKKIVLFYIFTILIFCIIGYNDLINITFGSDGSVYYTSDNIMIKNFSIKDSFFIKYIFLLIPFEFIENISRGWIVGRSE